MKTGIPILAGLLAGVLVAAGILAALVFVGPDPVGLRPTTAPTLVPPSPAASPSVGIESPAPTLVPPSPAASPSVGIESPAPSTACGSPAASGAPGAGCVSVPSDSPVPSADPGAAFHIGQPAPALVVPQGGGGTIDLANLRGKPVWLNFMQTTSPECVDEFPLMNAFAARYADTGLVVMAIDIREDEGLVASFADRLDARFPLGLDSDGKAQRAWGTYALPIHFWIDKTGIVRARVLGGAGPDAFAAGLQKILPGVKVTP